MKLGSLFDGIAGFPYSASKFNIKSAWASEIEPWPIRVSEKYFPDMKHLGDITKINGAEIEPVDIITFGSPCFPAGTLILTETGYRPIESVQIGDKVFTHKGNWKRVTDVGWKHSNTIILNGSHYGLELTPNHPIWSAETKKYYPTYSNGKRGNKRKLINVGEWTRADGMKGKRWAIPNSITGIKIPSITSCSNKANDAPQFNEDTFYFIGRWLGDGWLRDGQRPNRPDGQTWGQIFLCCSHDEAGNVEEMVKAVFPIATRLNERTVAKFRISNMSFAKWLKENFDEHAGQKTIPAWAYCMEDKYKQALLNGYIDSDGWDIRNGLKRATTVSVKLAHGIRLLAETLGYSTAVYKCEMPPSTTIEGRKVSQKTMYQIDINSNKRTNAIVTDTHNWYPIKEISSGRERVKVFNITVDDDCSYIAEGFVVHNCQDLSVAGKRAGLEGQRSGLFMDAIRIIREMRSATNGEYPRFAVWENVPGAYSSNGGQDFRAVLEEIAEAEIPMPKSGKWATAGMVRTERVDVAWRTLDAQYWGVPQRRRRIFLVADFGGHRAAEVLFVEQGLRRDTAESGEAREEAAATVGDGIEEEPSCLTPWNVQSHRVFSTNGISPTIQAREGGGGGSNCGLIVDQVSKCITTRTGCRFDAETETLIVLADQTHKPIPIHDKATRYKGGGDTRNNDGAANGFGIGQEGDPMPTLGTSDRHAVGYPDPANTLLNKANLSFRDDQDTLITAVDCRNLCEKQELSGTLQSKANGGYSLNYQNPVRVGYAVRRLTPLECLRLQGYPDYWLDIEGMSDTAKYRAIGNSLAIPCVDYVMEGIAEALKKGGVF